MESLVIAPAEKPKVSISARLRFASRLASMPPRLRAGNRQSNGMHPGGPAASENGDRAGAAPGCRQTDWARRAVGIDEGKLPAPTTGWSCECRTGNSCSGLPVWPPPCAGCAARLHALNPSQHVASVTCHRRSTPDLVSGPRTGGPLRGTNAGYARAAPGHWSATVPARCANTAPSAPVRTVRWGGTVPRTALRRSEIVRTTHAVDRRRH